MQDPEAQKQLAVALPAGLQSSGALATAAGQQQGAGTSGVAALKPGEKVEKRGAGMMLGYVHADIFQSHACSKPCFLAIKPCVTVALSAQMSLCIEPPLLGGPAYSGLCGELWSAALHNGTADRHLGGAAARYQYTR
jgi:hypothetical protein